MPRWLSSAPRKKLPPPTTIATSTRSTAAAISLAMRAHHIRVHAELSAAERLTGQFEQYPAAAFFGHAATLRAGLGHAPTAGPLSRSQAPTLKRAKPVTVRPASDSTLLIESLLSRAYS